MLNSLIILSLLVFGNLYSSVDIDLKKELMTCSGTEKPSCRLKAPENPIIVQRHKKCPQGYYRNSSSTGGDWYCINQSLCPNGGVWQENTEVLKTNLTCGSPNKFNELFFHAETGHFHEIRAVRPRTKATPGLFLLDGDGPSCKYDKNGELISEKHFDGQKLHGPSFELKNKKLISFACYKENELQRSLKISKDEKSINEYNKKSL